MALNQNAGYGNAMLKSLVRSGAGKTFVVSGAVGTGASAQLLQDIAQYDNDGVARFYPSITTALAACVAGRSDAIVIAADYTTAPTDTELGAAGTKGVSITYSNQTELPEQIAMTSNLALPQGATGTLFNVVGVCEVISIVGVVTTAIAAGTNNLKLATVSNSATTDISANLDIDADAAQSRYSITGTFANATLNTAKGVPVARQATPVVVQEGTIAAICSASSAGNIRWTVRYRPLQQGARIYA